MVKNSVDIIIPIYNQIDLTKNCLESIGEQSDLPYHLILIDNASDMETKNYLEAFAGSRKYVTLVRSEENLGWVKAVNQGIKLASSEYVCIMNNDTLVKTQGWLSKMIMIAEMAGDIGLVNPRFDLKHEPDGKKSYIEIDFCRGYCVLIKKAVICKIGGLDEAYGLGYYDDDDFSVRAIRAGFRCVRANNIVVEHLKDSTFSTLFKDDTRRALHEKNKKLFYSRWGKRLKVVFIASKNSDKANLEEALLFMARRQHIVYVWNRSEPLGLEHINIRETVLPGFLPSFVFDLALSMNDAKKEAKRYNIVFVDDKKLGLRLARKRVTLRQIDVNNDPEQVIQIVDSAAKV